MNKSKAKSLGNFRSITYEPTKTYLYEKKKFDYQAHSKCDRLKMFLRASQVWEGDKFLVNNHRVNSIQSKEGRKLNLAEYNRKFSQK